MKQKMAYKILCRFQSLIQSTNEIDIILPKFGKTRHKPLFTIYNSCIEEFKNYFLTEYKQLNLEPLPLYDSNGVELFTGGKLSTLLHQSEAIVALLKGLLPPNYSGNPETLKESVSWYWRNTHWTFSVFVVGIMVAIFFFGIFFGQSTLYKEHIKPLITEYKTQHDTNK